MVSSGFTSSKYDECVYIKHEGGADVAYLLLYVDDMLLAGACKNGVEKVKEDLRAVFEMKDLGPARRILGMSIIRDRKGKRIWLTQADYLSRILKKFALDNLKKVSVPMGQRYKLSADQTPKTEA